MMTHPWIFSQKHPQKQTALPKVMAPQSISVTWQEWINSIGHRNVNQQKISIMGIWHDLTNKKVVTGT
jgi:hypothetical protein